MQVNIVAVVRACGTNKLFSKTFELSSIPPVGGEVFVLDKMFNVVDRIALRKRDRFTLRNRIDYPDHNKRTIFIVNEGIPELNAEELALLVPRIHEEGWDLH